MQFIKSKVIHPHSQVTIADYDYPVCVLRFTCLQRHLILFSFPIFRFWAYLMTFSFQKRLNTKLNIYVFYFICILSIVNSGGKMTTHQKQQSQYKKPKPKPVKIEYCGIQYVYNKVGKKSRCQNNSKIQQKKRHNRHP